MLLNKLWNLLIFNNSKKKVDPLKLFLKSQWLKIDVGLYINRFGKNSLWNRDSFCLRSSCGGGWVGAWQQPPGSYRDADYTMALYKSKKIKIIAPDGSDYLACIGFNVDNNDILVTQIQGSRGKREILRTFKWERMLLAILTDWAKQNGFAKIKVIQAKKQSWYRQENKDRAERMFMHYDVTAKRSGFKLDKQIGLYVKPLI